MKQRRPLLRLRKVQGSTTIDYAYDATDQLKKQTIAGLDTIYSYSAYGDLTQSGTSVSTVTSYGYDTASHMISTNGPGGTSDDASFSLDALGLMETPSLGGRWSWQNNDPPGNASSSDAISMPSSSTPAPRLALATRGSQPYTIMYTADLPPDDPWP